MRKQAILLSSVMIGLSILSAACSSKRESHEPVTLTIAGVIPEFFTQQHGEQLVLDGQEINLNFVPYGDMPQDREGNIQYEQLFSQFSLDILFFAGTAALKPLIDGGLVMPLDSFANDSKALDAIAPMVLNNIRKSGEGQLYAWPGAFRTEALFYNKELLDRYHVPYPEQASSWSDLMKLTTQLSNAVKNESSGIVPFLDPGKNDPEEKLFWLIYNAGQSEGLQLIQPQTLEVTANSDGWKELAGSFIDAYKQGGISNEEYEQVGTIKLEQGVTDESRYKPFLDGRAAFVLGDPSLIYMLNKANSSWWGIANQPGSQQLYSQISEMYGINSNSSHTAEAWKLIEYLTGDENIQEQASNGGGGGIQNVGDLPARVSVLEKALSLDLSPFYDQELAVYGVYDPSPIPSELFVAMRDEMMKQIGSVLRGEETVDQALTQLQGSLEASSRAASQ
ncbi:ABC transporter substrate-binding protein [Paenibacillus kobensis]|uniref:ABC transporter substrate-binding protein n=1 Tax=Paenibacillus kobensis TaxID=59841 RepID=UPI000FD973EE|nr:extracellular solute-binding protein [Paenibacillus kobensis]